jgi:hypothetical protein
VVKIRVTHSTSPPPPGIRSRRTSPHPPSPDRRQRGQNDNVTVATTITKPCTLNGNAGNDAHRRERADAINGGAGDDNLMATAGTTSSAAATTTTSWRASSAKTLNGALGRTVTYVDKTAANVTASIDAQLTTAPPARATDRHRRENSPGIEGRCPDKQRRRQHADGGFGNDISRPHGNDKLMGAAE